MERRSGVRTLNTWKEKEEFRRGAGVRTVRARGGTPGASVVATVPNSVALPSSCGNMWSSDGRTVAPVSRRWGILILPPSNYT